jgi:uncharacterized protein YceK
MSKIQTGRFIVCCPILLLMIAAGCSALRDHPAGGEDHPDRHAAFSVSA